MAASAVHDRVLYPATGFTLADAIDYYRRAAKVLLPHLMHVPLSFKRYPDTVRGESFWEKDAPSFTPSWMKTVAVPRRTGQADIHYVVVNTSRALQWLVSVGGIEIHPFLHRAPKLEVATSVVFDLDPGEGATIVDCCRVAVLLRDALERIDLESLAKVSGSKGLQVYVPLNDGKTTHEVTEPFARMVAQELAKAYPKLVVAEMQKRFRTKKVFIDWSQNADYKSTVAVYSLRAKRERPYVSMPLSWDEVEKADAAALDFEPAAALKRITRSGDLFAPVLKLEQSLHVRRIPAKRVRAARSDEEPGAIVHGVRLPRYKSQSGRRLFVLPKTETGDELWLDMHGRFKRWILRPGREGGARLIAMPAGDFPLVKEYFRGAVPAQWKGRVEIRDVGAYELIEGSYQRRRFDLFFTGHALRGEWILEKVNHDPKHRSWSFAPK